MPTGYKILDLTVGVTPDSNTWFEVTQNISGNNRSRRLSATTLLSYFTPDLSAYLTSATAASTYVPLTRTITINGTTHDLSANRTWTISAGGETLEQTLALGNTSGAYDILMNVSQRVGFKDGDNINTSYLSNNQTTGGSRTAYLPLYTGQLAYHATGVALTTNYILKGTTNGAITSSSLIYDDGTNVGIGETSMAAKLHVKSTTAGGLAGYFKNTNSGTSTYTRVQLDSYDGAKGLVLGSFGSNYTNNANLTNSSWVASYEANLNIVAYSSVIGNLKDIRFGYYLDNTNAWAEWARFLQPNGFFGLSVTDPAAYLDIKGGITDAAPLRIRAGVAPTGGSLLDGCMWYENTNDRVMFRQNTASNEFILASAVTTEAVTSDTTVTIQLNGVTYKLLAKA